MQLYSKVIEIKLVQNRYYKCLPRKYQEHERCMFFQVDDLKDKLAAQEEELAIKNEDANKLIAVVGAEQEKVSKEKAFANEEQKKVAVIAEDVGQKQKVCSIELAKAEPALIAAKAALDTLNKV